jgi:hypothetical protein
MTIHDGFVDASGLAADVYQGDFVMDGGYLMAGQYGIVFQLCSRGRI